MRRLCPLAVVVLGLVLGVAACGSEERDDAGTPPAPGDTRGDLEHIHGLGVDPGSGELFVATHYGLFHAAEGQAKLARMGRSRQDIMGFSIIGPRRYIGSGHPDPSQNLPPNLGLIESRDGGQSWKNVALLGEADFHVLRSAGSHVYGFNSGTGKLMVSTDDGRKWTEHDPPGAMIDLAIDPTDNKRVVASTERGIFTSQNAGDAWRPLSDDAAGLLAWPSARALFLVDGQGGVARSSDAGASFDPVGSIDGQPSAFVSHGDDLYAALGNGNVLASADGGSTWSVRATP